jgi:hypothetical protein
MTPISSLTRERVTVELIDHVARAGPDERRILYYLVDARPVDAVSRDRLTDAVATLPEDEQRILLYLARRICGVGLDQYGHLELASDRRDWAAESCAEDADGTVYRVCDLLTGRDPGPLLRDTLHLMRRSVAAGIQRGSL